jgi:hypothetical protein
VRFRNSRSVGWSLALAASTLLPPPSAAAQETRIAPRASYDADPAKAWFLGDDYRDLWTAPILVPTIDLSRFAGGLTPIRRGGGRQTISLHLRGADGREYTFRSVDKRPAQAQHPDLRGAALAKLIQDQVSSTFPAGNLVAARLSEAAGVLTPQPALFVMPDDPILGEFREEFAGMLGTIEERPNEGEGGSVGFGGFTRIVSTDRMLESLREEPTHVVDARGFLHARLFDLFLGDWDRHGDQWRWARIDTPTGSTWVPIARDRDYAFADYEGVAMDLVRLAVPNAVRFRADVEEVDGLVMNAETLDRELLGWLTRTDWEATVTGLQARLTDEAIDAAITAMPPEYQALRGAELASHLRARRDALPTAAGDFYERMARLVELRLTDGPDDVIVERLTDGRVRVEARTAGTATVRARTFEPDDTREIRVDLRGGDDRAHLGGAARRGIRVRVIGGAGEDEMVDASDVAGGGRWTTLHDDDPEDRLRGGRATLIDRRPYHEPRGEPRGLVRIPISDFGTRTSLMPIIGHSTTRGATFGGSVTRTTYAFRHYPFARRITLSARYAPRWSALAVDAAARFESPTGRVGTRATVRASGIDFVRFYGFGNGSPEPTTRREAVTRLERYAGAGEVVVRSGAFEGGFGPVLERVRPRPEPGSIVREERPLGWDGWSALGADLRAGFRRGLAIGDSATVLVTGGAGLRTPFRAVDPYGTIRGSGALTVSFGSAWTHAEAAVHGAWGAYPFFDAAFVGGRNTLRGFAEDRFAGDAMTRARLETGVDVGRLPVLMNWRTSLFALADIGRVFHPDDPSSRWHAGFGGGVQLSAFEYGIRASVARGADTRLYLELRPGT